MSLSRDRNTNFPNDFIKKNQRIIKDSVYSPPPSYVVLEDSSITKKISGLSLADRILNTVKTIQEKRYEKLCKIFT